MVESVVWGAAAGVLFVVGAGLRRVPWRYATFVGVGAGIAFWGVRLTNLGVDPGLLVLVGALGGSLSTLAFERGERARERRSAAILAG